MLYHYWIKLDEVSKQGSCEIQVITEFDRENRIYKEPTSAAQQITGILEYQITKNDDCLALLILASDESIEEVLDQFTHINLADPKYEVLEITTLEEFLKDIKQRVMSKKARITRE